MRARPRTAARAAGAAAPWLILVMATSSVAFPSEALAQVGGEGEAVSRADPVVRPFEHFRHQAVTCGVCHARDERHRVARAWAPDDCAACHHGEAPPAGCDACHDRPDFARPLSVTASMDLSVWDAPRGRELSFEHADHGNFGCLDCHRSGMSRPPESCASCHIDHQEDFECARCHVAPDPAVHPLEAHASCGGSGCHADEVLSRPMLSRASCLVCHDDRQDHRPEGSCAACHIMPPGRDTE